MNLPLSTNRGLCALAVGALSILLPSAAMSQQAASPARVNVAKLGPQQGEVVPDFRLQDGRGKTWTRDALMGPKGAMIVFSRSLDWCPYCKTQTIELQTRLGELAAQGLGLAVITYDPPEVLADFANRRGITFPLLSDAGSATIKQYGILNTTVSANTSNYGIPFPGTFLVDRAGRVTARFFEEAYQERNTVASILIALGGKGGAAEATRVETEHLTITSYLSDETVAPGSLFSVVMDVTPRAGIHVYAPGANDYRIIKVAWEPNPLLSVRPLQYPESETYYFKPLDERVPVFQKPFRLVGLLSLAATPDARAALKDTESVTIRGTLEYQACDDRICFNPRSIPISHSVRIRQLDTARTTVKVSK